MGFVKLNFDWDWSGAERDFKRAIELNPNSVLAHRVYSVYFTVMGQSQEAIAEAKQAQQLDPLSLPVSASLGVNYMLLRRYDEAIAQYKNVLDLDPNYALPRAQLIWCYTLKGMYPEAIAEYNAHKEDIREQGYTGKFTVAFLHAASGRKKEALKLVDEWTRLSAGQDVDPYGLAVALRVAGQGPCVSMAGKRIRGAFSGDARSEGRTLLRSTAFRPALPRPPPPHELPARPTHPLASAAPTSQASLAEQAVPLQ